MAKWRESDADEDLLKASLRDGDAFAVVYRRYARALYGFFITRVGSAGDAEDLTAEVFAAVIASRTRFDPQRGPFETWLWQIARNKLNDHLRHRAVVDRHRRSAAAAVAEPTVDEYDLGASKTPALVALSNLSPTQRDAISAHVIDDLSQVEIARAQGTEPATVRKRVSRGLATLRQRLGDSEQITDSEQSPITTWKSTGN